MELQFKNKLGRGGFGDVWLAYDPALGREVAVKFVRASAEATVSVSDHAKALVKIDNPHVVKVHALENLVNPDGSQTMPAIVMEYVPGPTLEEHLSRDLDPNAARRLIDSLWDGLQAIHRAGVGHQDFHAANVLVPPTGAVKIIDILHRGVSRVQVSEESIALDVRNFAGIVMTILRRANVLESLVSSKVRPLLSQQVPSGDAICAEARGLLDGAHGLTDTLKRSYQAFIDPDFDDTFDYARALNESIPDEGVEPLLLRIVREAHVRPAHRTFLAGMSWRASADAEATFLRAISEGLRQASTDQEITRHVRIIAYFNASRWAALEALPRLRTEGKMIGSVQAGQYTHWNNTIVSGHLGTWAKTLSPYFGTENRKRLLDALNSSLRGSWNAQNYVAVYFFGYLSGLNLTAAEEEELVEGIRQATRVDARKVTELLGNLPASLRQRL